MYLRFWKPLADRCLAALLLLCALPPGLCIALGLYLCYGKIFFVQKRITQFERPFYILKFITMLPDAQGQPQATRWGKYLRQSHLDELPQLLNILRGEMSFVGPRPLLPEYLPHYQDWERRRHQVKGGLTGFAQIHGGQSLDWHRKMQYDAWYVAHCNWALDCAILWATLSGRSLLHRMQAEKKAFGANK